MQNAVRVSGIVWGAFKHRFALETETGKTLIDIGPKTAEKLSISEGDRIEVEGERKPSEVKAHAIKFGGKTHKIDWPDKPKGPKHHHDGATPDAAMKAVADDGYKIKGDPERHPKHWEIAATRNGRSYELHVELDGRIRKIKPLD
ncbi:MAG: hypothetical protein QM651_19500 [Rhodoblastus sp.]